MSAKTYFVCDACNDSAFSPPLASHQSTPSLPEGWISGGGILRGPHLCPTCAGEYRIEAGPAEVLPCVDWRPGMPPTAPRLDLGEWAAARRAKRVDTTTEPL